VIRLDKLARFARRTTGIWEFVAVVAAVITIQLVPPVVVGLLLAKRTPAHVGKAPLHHRHYLLPEASSANLGFKCVLVASHAQTARLRIANARISTSLAILLVEPHVRIMDVLRVVGIAHALSVPKQIADGGGSATSQWLNGVEALHVADDCVGNAFNITKAQ
jgi:hypothetical protein